MKGEIDLLKARKQTGFEQLRRQRLVKTGSLVFLIFYCLLAAGIFFFGLYLSQADNQLEQKISLQVKRLGQLKKVESLQVLLKQRMTFLLENLNQAPPAYQQVVLDLERITPSGLVLTEVSFLPDQEMAISGEAANAVVVSQFLELFKNELVDKYFDQMLVDSLDREEDGPYKFSLVLKLNEKNKPIN